MDFCLHKRLCQSLKYAEKDMIKNAFAFGKNSVVVRMTDLGQWNPLTQEWELFESLDK